MAKCNVYVIILECVQMKKYRAKQDSHDPGLNVHLTFDPAEEDIGGALYCYRQSSLVLR